MWALDVLMTFFVQTFLIISKVLPVQNAKLFVHLNLHSTPTNVLGFTCGQCVWGGGGGGRAQPTKNFFQELMGY